MAAHIKCKLLACLLVLIVMVTGSCNSNPAPSQPPPPKQPKYEVYTVEIKDMKFVPDSIVVKPGDEVVFVNRDMVNHCVTEEKSKAWTSGSLPSGESYLLVAKESTDYYCAIHTVMKGKIIVK